MKKEMLAEVNERRQIDPALCLLMWATALNGDGPREVLKGLGVYHDELYVIFGGHEQEMAKLRQMRMVAEIFNRELIAKLLRVRLAELLMQCAKASDYAALMRAVKIMPEWVLGEQPGVDLRTEDPAFDDVMNQPLEDEDGNRLAPDFGTLAAGGPLLADRLYEQIRAKRAPGEVAADSNGADVGDNGADAEAAALIAPEAAALIAPEAAASVPPDEANETRTGSALIAGSKLAMALVNPGAVFNKPPAPLEVKPRNGKPRSRRRARP